MKIETKFNIGDYVFAVDYNNTISAHPIDYITFYKNDGIVYKCGYNYQNNYREDCGDIFGTFEEAKAEAISRFTAKLEKPNKEQ